MSRIRLFIIVFLAVFSQLINAAESSVMPESAIKTVANLYKDYAWEAVLEEPDLSNIGLMEQPKAILSKYFSKKLVGLILKDRECVHRTREACRIESLPIWASQDPGATGLKITAAQEPNSILVSFRYPSTGEIVEIKFSMVLEGRNWLISDISSNSGGSLLKVLDASP